MSSWGNTIPPSTQLLLPSKSVYLIPPRHLGLEDPADMLPFLIWSAILITSLLGYSIAAQIFEFCLPELLGGH